MIRSPENKCEYCCCAGPKQETGDDIRRPMSGQVNPREGNRADERRNEREQDGPPITGQIANNKARTTGVKRTMTIFHIYRAQAKLLAAMTPSPFHAFVA